MLSDEILFQITGDPSWGDHCENVAFNSYPAAVMPDFKSLRYLTAPNMVLSDSKNHAPGIANGGPFLLMNPFSSRCCQHNHSQGWPYFSRSLWMATADNGELMALSGFINPYPGKLGVVEEGALADLLLVDGNPLENIKLVEDPDKNFLVIMKDGTVYKDTVPK